MPLDFDQLARTLPGMGRDALSVRRRIEALEQLLEGAFVIPVLRRRVGLDAFLGMVPVAGDVVAATLGAWLVWEARNLGMPKRTLARMAANVAFDMSIGAIPLVGDAFDFFFRSNTRNLKLLKRHLDRHHPQTATISVQPARS